jgi:hypothetical protein
LAQDKAARIREPCRNVVRAVGHLRHLKVVHARDVLHDAVACVVSDVDAEGKMRLDLHGQVRLDSSWPTGIYTPS